MRSLKQRLHALKREVNALRYAYQDTRTPVFAKVLTALILGYAFSPIDLIPDPIPVLGYLDDLILIPLRVVIVLRLIPDHVMADALIKADRIAAGKQAR